MGKHKRGYYSSPNTSIPLNDREPGAIAPVAMEQLRAYQGRADHWPVFRVRRDGRDLYACQECEQALWFNTDEEEQPFVYKDHELRALKVAHIRRSHDGQ